MRKKVFTLLVVLAFAMSLAFSQVVLAHGGVDDGHEERAWLKPALAVGGLVVFGGGAFVALKRR